MNQGRHREIGNFLSNRDKQYSDGNSVSEQVFFERKGREAIIMGALAGTAVMGAGVMLNLVGQELSGTGAILLSPLAAAYESLSRWRSALKAWSAYKNDKDQNKLAL